MSTVRRIRRLSRFTLLPPLLGLVACSDGLPEVPHITFPDTVPWQLDQGPAPDGPVYPPDAGAPDAGAPDQRAPDAFVADARVPDAGAPDSGAAADLSLPDSGGAKPDLPAADAAGAHDAGGAADKGVAPSPDALSPDAGAPDSGSADAGPPGKEVVLFSSTPTYYRYTLTTVGTDGAGAKYVPGYTQDLQSAGMYLTGVNGPLAVRRDRPQAVQWGSGEMALLLPGQGGQVLYWMEDTASYLLHVKADATVTTLHSTAQKNGYEPYGHISGDGKLLAVTRKAIGSTGTDPNKVLLIRLDGTSWSSSGTAVLDVSPLTQMKYVSATSLFMTNTYLYFIATEPPASGSNDDYRLFKAPLDGTAVASKVTLPALGGAAEGIPEPTFNVTGAADGKTLAFVAGSAVGSSDQQVFLLDDGGTLRQATTTAGAYEVAGRYFHYGWTPELAVSPAAKYLAVLRAGQPYVVKADGTSEVALNTAAHFDSTVTTFGAFFWATDDDLLFWAGGAGLTAELFHYRVSGGALANLTQTGTASAAPWTVGDQRLDGGFVSPNGKFIYYFSYQYPLRNIIAVDLTTFTKKDITAGLQVLFPNSTPGTEHQGLPGSSRVWFLSQDPASLVTYMESLYSFDANTGAKATQLELRPGTAKSPFTSGGFTLSPGGKYYAYVTGGNTNSELWIGPAAGGTIKLRDSGPWISRSMRFTADDRALVFGGGVNNNGIEQLKLISSVSGNAQVIYNPVGYTRVLAVGP